MTRLLLRAHKDPFRVVDAEQTLAENTIGDNAGNLIFLQAAYRLLSTSGTQIETSRLNRDTELDADEINEEYDGVVIPLANGFRPKFAPNLDAMSELIEKLTIPVTVLGVGVQAGLEGEVPADAQTDASVKRFAAAVLDRSPSIGVRGAFTRDYLKTLGFGDEHVSVVGCPSMFMDGSRLAVDGPERLSHASPIALNVSPYVSQMGPVTARHAERFPNLVYIAQERAALELLLRGEYHGRGTSPLLPIHADHQLFAEDRVRFFLDPSTWIRQLADFEFSFGTRIHGNIAALLAGTPAFVLVHDSRTLELAEYHEIPHRRITDVTDEDDAITLYEEADWGPMCASHPARFEEFAGFLARHRLSHVFEPGESPARFDEAMGEIEFPSAVQTPKGLAPSVLYEQLARSRELEQVERDRDHARAELEAERARWDASFSGRVAAFRRRLRLRERLGLHR